jgi:hypothetical protein
VDSYTDWQTVRLVSKLPKTGRNLQYPVPEMKDEEGEIRFLTITKVDLGIQSLRNKKIRYISTKRGY